MYKWNSGLAVGLPNIDSQHQQLFALVDEIHNAMKAGKAKTIVGQVLDQLVTYTVKHFAAEEALLRTKNYADLARHKLLHDQFTAKIMGMQQQYKSGATLINVELMDFLSKWLVNHIQGEDMKYAGVIAAQAAGAR